MTGLAVVLSQPGDDLLKYALPDGRSLTKAVAFVAPHVTNKAGGLTEVRKPAKAADLTPASRPEGELVKPDVRYWNDWPVRQPFLIFGALSAGRDDWLAAWKQFEPDPTVEEIRRNLPIRHPVLWLS